MLILDTNVISELRTSKPHPSPKVLHWARAQPAAHFYLSVVTVFELERGVLLMERRDVEQGHHLRQWLQGVKQTFGERVLPYGMRTATLCAGLHVPNPRPERDAIIAATALEHGMTLVTRNVADFSNMGLKLINPWESI